MNKFTFKKGITESQIDELIFYANNDPQIISFTSDKTRFADKKAFKLWLKKKPVIYTLTNNTGRLLGIIWFQRKIGIPGYDLTFAIRLYGKARGKGLSYGFMKQAFDDFKPQKVWLEVSIDNLPAVSLYKKFGFQQITDPNDKGKIIMVRKSRPNQSS